MPEQVLRKAEHSAGGPGNHSGTDAVGEARSAESQPEESFVSSVAGKQSDKNAKAKLSGLKKKGPLIAIIALLAIIIGLIFAAQSLMPFAVVNRIIEEFNTNGISSVLRADNILDYQLSSPGDTFGLTDYQKSSLRQNSIIPLDHGGGTVLVYETSERGTWKVVHGTTPSSPDIGKIQSQLKSSYSDITFSKLEPITIDEAMEDGRFKGPYTTASKTWRGGNSGWYDTLTSLNEALRGIQRSRIFMSGATKLNVVTRLAARNIMRGQSLKDIENTDTVKTTEAVQATDPNSDPITQDVGRTDYQNGINKATVLNAVSKGVSAASNAAFAYCTYVEIANKIQTIVHAVSNIQQMNLITGFAESVQAVQVGREEAGPVMNEYATNLVDKDGNGKTAIEAAGMGGLLTGAAIDPNDESVKTASPEGAFANLSKSKNPISNAIATALSGAGSFLNAMTTCTYIKGTLSVVSTILTVVGVATGGAGALLKLGIQTIIGLVASAAIGEIAKALVNWFWDSYGEILEKDLATEVVGEDLGNALTSGANKYLSSNHQIGGGSPATGDALLSFRRQQQVVIAEEAEYQRSIRSPFDVRSQYTFLGSIVYSLVPLASSSGTGSIIKNISSILGSSVSNLLPTASAVAETNLINSIGTCPTLESIGIVGDAYCNPYFISDTSTNTSLAMQKKLGEYTDIASLTTAYSTSTGGSNYLSPQEVIKKVYSLGGIESTTPTSITDKLGNTKKAFKIVENSNLYKYANYCGTRTSDWGFADANIAQQLQQSRTESSWWSKIPILGSAFVAVANMIEAGNDSEWISGYNCVARAASTSCSESDNSKECFWQNQGKYYQRFIEDQRYLIASGSTEVTSDPVTVALDVESNPIDNSYEGILARYSGMTKDDVIATLELIEGLNYLADYHPEERVLFGAGEINSSVIYFDQTMEDLANFIALEPRYVIYDTLRNRATIG